MLSLKEQYITDADGQRVGVILDWTSWQALLAELEELEDLRAFDEALAASDEVIPVEQAIEEIERDQQ